MTEFKEAYVEHPAPALEKTLRQICERTQQYFANPLIVDFCDASEYPSGFHSYYYIAEVRTKYWLGIIPRDRSRVLFYIYPGFYGGAYGVKEIRCGLFDRSLLEAVREEVQKYADAFKATAVDLEKDFAA